MFICKEDAQILLRQGSVERVAHPSRGLPDLLDGRGERLAYVALAEEGLLARADSRVSNKPVCAKPTERPESAKRLQFKRTKRAQQRKKTTTNKPFALK